MSTKTPTKKKSTVVKKTAAKKVKPWVLVTGANGALAQAVINKLKHQYRIVAVDARAAPLLDKDIPSFKINLLKREFEQLFKDYPIKGVIHLGRISTRQMSKKMRYAANVVGSKRLLDLCVKYKVENVLVLSTYHVYGATPYNPALLDEEAPLKATEITMDLVDSVELENLCNVYLWKHPEINLITLRPCNILGPGINNTLSKILKRKRAPILMGFSPIMQFIHLVDMADAIAIAFQKGHRGIYNVAPDDWVSYTTALEACNCKTMPIISMPELISRQLVKRSPAITFPLYLYNYFKYPVTIDNTLFKETFGFTPKYSLADIFGHYREQKERMA